MPCGSWAIDTCVKWLLLRIMLVGKNRGKGHVGQAWCFVLPQPCPRTVLAVLCTPVSGDKEHRWLTELMILQRLVNEKRRASVRLWGGPWTTTYSLQIFQRSVRSTMGPEPGRPPSFSHLYLHPLPQISVDFVSTKISKDPRYSSSFALVIRRRKKS